VQDAASTRNLVHEGARRTANLQDGPGAEEGVGQAFVLSRAPSVAGAAPVLRVLMEAVLAGVQRDDIVSARAAANALVAFLDGLSASGAGDNVIRLAERGPMYRTRPRALYR
jgi:hypothetical protein